ncbi:heavy-metal-associated domain-containing protein [Tranquillimonas alkanivorans]|uniref:Copper chaperone CopZ n=1 Tax=Tranquillimonas alkanivorans TaxID=441119 RepID=A0A1I5TVH3_9RHOB|nr:cation transporter [Tranquillimonas alkanivorans]SFP87080.1 Copper chaperone CopZ [Tranquillimonas alkanivorans]
MKRILLAAILLLAPATVLAGDAQTRLHVTGLTCPSCSYIVATALKRVDTVEIAEFVEGDAEDGTYVLHYDDSVTDPEALIATVTGVGYGATLADGSGS